MNENELALRLSRLEIPGRAVALDRCLDAYRESAIVHERPAKRSRFVPRRQFRLALALAWRPESWRSPSRHPAARSPTGSPIWLGWVSRPRSLLTGAHTSRQSPPSPP